MTDEPPDGMTTCRHGYGWPYHEVAFPGARPAIIPLFCDEQRDHQNRRSWI